MNENSILRKNAREQLGGNIFAKPWLMLLLVSLVYSAIVGAVSGITFGIAAIVVTGPLLFGLCRVCVNLIKGKQDIDIGEIFVGFKENFTQSFLLYLLTSIFTFLWSLLFIIPGIVKMYAYAMAPYILQDDPTKDWKQCLDESQEMMKGNKWQLFCLDFSFIGWMLLGALCCGVGVLFVYPYQLAARANFYMALKAMNEPAQGNDNGADSEPVDPFQ